MRQAGVLAAPGLIALTKMPPLLALDHARASKLARSLSELPAFVVDLANVQTNIVMVDVPQGKALAIMDRFRDQGVLVVALNKSRIRFVTHHQVTDEDVDRAIEAARIIAKAL
jgi:threonine aldolase